MTGLLHVAKPAPGTEFTLDSCDEVGINDVDGCQFEICESHRARIVIEQLLQHRDSQTNRFKALSFYTLTHMICGQNTVSSDHASSQSEYTESIRLQ